MDVLMGPTFTIDVSPPQAAAYSLSQPETQGLFLEHRVSSVVEGEEEDDGLVGSISISNRSRLGLAMAGSGKSLDDSSDISSSVGAPDDDSGEEEEEEDGESNSSSGASSSLKKGLGSLGSMDALEDALPSKRGLSNYFAGKSKSFASLSDACLVVSQAKDLEKPEHPFNKRRRILMANKWSRRSSFYSWHNPNSMPLLTLNEDDDDDSESGDHRNGEADEEDRRESLTSSSSWDKDEDEEDGKRVLQRKLLQERKFKNSFKSHSCFSLTDLQQEQQRQQKLNLPPRR